jgi:hypothetical protein
MSVLLRIPGRGPRGPMSYVPPMRRTVLALLVLAAGAGGFAACGGQTNSGAGQGGASDDATLPGDSGDAGNPGDPDSGASDAADGAPPSACPASAPSRGTSCAKSGLECTYGTGPHLSCRTHATCNGGAWFVQACDAGGCPASAEPDAACPSNGESCGYAGGATCDCYACIGACVPNAQNTWHCTVQPSDCPSSAPNLGSGCTGDAGCDYGGCTGGWSVACENGVWTRVLIPCPG